jgi:hypothetical protein
MTNILWTTMSVGVENIDLTTKRIYSCLPTLFVRNKYQIHKMFQNEVSLEVNQSCFHTCQPWRLYCITLNAHAQHTAQMAQGPPHSSDCHARMSGRGTDLETVMNCRFYTCTSPPPAHNPIVLLCRRKGHQKLPTGRSTNNTVQHTTDKNKEKKSGCIWHVSIIQFSSQFR